MTAPVERAGPLLSDEIAAFLESGLGIIAGIVSADGHAQTGWVLAVRVAPRDTIRLIYRSEGNAALTATAQTGGPIAVTFSAPISHRTIQIKGTLCKVEQLEPEDQASMERQLAAFSATLSAIGYTPAFVQGFCDYRSSILRVLSFSAQAAFEQTPGPGAGRSI